MIDFNKENRHVEWIIEEIRKKKHQGVVIIDEDLVNDKEALRKKYGNGDLII